MPLVFEPEGYNITEYGTCILPPALLHAICRTFYVEFLQVKTDGMTVAEAMATKNHAIIKLDFENGVDIYRGARILMNVDFEIASDEDNVSEPRYRPGKLLLKPVTYPYPSTNSARTFRIGLAPNTTVGNLLDALLRQHMQFFHFIAINDKYYGCRDFITQAICRMASCGYIHPHITGSAPAVPQLPINNVYDALGIRFNAINPMVLAVYPVDKGDFTYYTRDEQPGMPYAGSQRARQLQALLS
ncbi:hypothetical protein PRK78_006728 [Emydomyces testavorans]|uniref:DUF7770 domain-containing protein n=1 Tax=Emydomyces testavorans TaxID=2070801 RepID=A0AAF0DN14_9EURO|nr:hypothetical protein PRK78_006728 [Emydomyces testavorans]